MTAQLRLVPAYATEEDLTMDADDHAQQLIGALMYSDAEDVERVLEIVPDDAIGDPTGRWAFELIRRVVREGGDVDPIAILVAGRRHPGHDESAIVPIARHHDQLALYLVDASAAAPAADVDTCVRAVLHQAYRRAFDAGGKRMQALAAANAPRAELARQFHALTEELNDLTHRTDTAERSRP